MVKVAKAPLVCAVVYKSTSEAKPGAFAAFWAESS
jgi:hypothetical protein